MTAVIFINIQMACFVDFEDIDAWRYARKSASEIYAATNKGSFSRDFSLKDQLRRSSASVMANIAEGFETNGTNEFIYFLGIAKGSIGEVGSLLCIAMDQGYINRD